MNEQQCWAFIEDLFKQIAEQCEAILRLLGEQPSSVLMDYAGKKQVDLFMGTDWQLTGKEVGEWLKEQQRIEHDDFIHFVAGPWHEDDSPHTPTTAPISDDEAKRLLEDAKGYLEQGA